MQVCNRKAVLADYAKDTIFIYQNGKTSPLFVRKPSVFASLPFILSSTDFMTDRFLFLVSQKRSIQKKCSAEVCCTILQMKRHIVISYRILISNRLSMFG